MQGLTRILIVGKDADNDKKLAETLKKIELLSDRVDRIAEILPQKGPDTPAGGEKQQKE